MALKLSQPTREVASVQQNEGLPLLRGQNPGMKFLYCVYPRGWSFHPSFGFLPDLKKLTAKPGCNGVSDNGDLTRTIAGVNSKGGVVLDPNDPRLGDYQGYVQYYSTQCGRRWYVDFCQEATVLPSGEILWTISEDLGEDPWNSFRLQVRDSGIVPRLVKEVYLAMESRMQRELDSLSGRLSMNPALTKRYEEKAQELEAMRKAWDDYTPKKKKRAPKKKTAQPALQRQPADA